MRFRLLVPCMIFLCASTVSGNGAPELTVYNGENVIPLTVCNETDRPVGALAVAADQTSLPAWLVVPQTTVPLLSTEDAHEVTFPLTVVDAPEGTQAALSLFLSDDMGRTWQVRMNVRVGLPAEDVLLPNAPNPFNPDTTIRYHLSGTEARPTTLIIYNALGQPVRALVNASQAPGVYRVHWDGRDDGGRVAGSGVYIYRIVSGAFRQTRRMLLLK